LPLCGNQVWLSIPLATKFHATEIDRIAGSYQTSRLEDRVDQVATMLKEIHEWFIRNLRDATSTTQTATTGDNDQSSLLPDLSFEPSAESVREPELICRHACLHDYYSEGADVDAGVPSRRRCRCTTTADTDRAPSGWQSLTAVGSTWQRGGNGRHHIWNSCSIGGHADPRPRRGWSGRCTITTARMHDRHSGGADSRSQRGRGRATRMKARMGSQRGRRCTTTMTVAQVHDHGGPTDVDVRLW
jgi:hypothetical protein